jgi:SAM-dependent methyltransferase
MATPPTTAPEGDELPPFVRLYHLLTGHYVSSALYVAAELGVADHLAAGPQGHVELARATGAHAPSLRRVLRLLASAGVFAEAEDGRFTLTSIGECLRGDLPGSFRSTARLLAGPLVWASWGDLLHTVRTGEMALRHVFGTDSFEYLEQHPEEGAVFDDAMTAFTAMVAVAVTAAYDFSRFRTVVDVGGGQGTLLAGILKATPSLRGILFEMPRVVERARRQLAAAGLGARCEVVGGDFFTSVPSGGDAYLLKHVLHDWDDDRAGAILASCHRAMAPGATLLVVEGVYPPRVDQSLESRGAALNDVNMLVVTGGRQRSEAEFRALFAAGGFELIRIVPTFAAACVIEGVRV